MSDTKIINTTSPENAPLPVFLDTSKVASPDNEFPAVNEFIGPKRTFSVFTSFQQMRSFFTRNKFFAVSSGVFLSAIVLVAFGVWVGYKVISPAFHASAPDALAARFLAAGASLTVVDVNGKDIKVAKAIDVTDPLLITGITLGTNADISVLKELYQLRGLHNLYISNISVSQSELISYLKTAPPTIISLQLSKLNGIEMNTDLLKTIRTAFPSLKTLNIRGLKLSEDSFSSIASPYLQTLVLAETETSDEDVALLKDMNLATLDVGMTHITEVGLVQLRPYIKTLNLDSLKIADAQIKIITEHFQNLQKLEISNTAVTDASIPSLQNLTELVSLTIKGTSISEAGIARIQQKLPNCKIVK